jgi:hypothetical protein
VRTAIFALAAIVASALLVPVAEAVPALKASPLGDRTIQPVAEGYGYGWP